MPVLLGMLVIVFSGMTFGVRSLGRFLSPTEPVGRGALLIEGWVSREQFGQAIALYKEGGYTLLLTTGGPFFLDCDRDDVAYVAQVAKLATSSGLNPADLHVVRVPRVTEDRTRAAAIATARWLKSRSDQSKSVDVVSVGPHTRRSWVVYREILEPTGIAVGAVAVSPDYDINAWWSQSAGVKAVVSEALGWFWEVCCASHISAKEGESPNALDDRESPI